MNTKNYFVARNYSSSLLPKQFQKVSQFSCDNARKPCSKVLKTDSVKFGTSYNPILPNINSLINKYLPILHADLDLKELFPRKSITTVYGRKKTLQKCQHHLLILNQLIAKEISEAEWKFTSKVTGKSYFTKGDLSCNSKNVIYLITCDKCKDADIGSAVDFKPSFRVHKSDIKTKKERSGTSRHFNEKCLCSTSPFRYVKVQIIKQVYSE